MAKKAAKKTTTKKIRKQVSFWVEIDQWKAIRAAAAAQGVSMTYLFVGLMKAGLDKLCEDFSTTKPANQ
jgi:hypothetical protein